MAFSFGTPANNSQQTSTPFSFGSSIPAQNNSGSLFGNQQSNTNTSSNTFSFGGHNTNNQAQTQAKPAFSFGGSNTAAAPAATANQPFSFGTPSNNNNNNNNTGLFGAQNTQQPQSGTPGGLFGQQQSTPATNGGLFGQQSTNNAGTNSLFGQNGNSQAMQNNNSAGLFGQQNTNTNDNTGSNLFGQQNSGSSLFGQSNKQSSGLFGTTQPASNSGGLFGQSVTAQQPNPGNSLFGNVSQEQNQANTSNQGQLPQNTQISQAPQPSLAQSIYGQTSAQPQFSWSRPNQSLGQSVMPSFNMPPLSLAQSRFSPAQASNTNLGGSIQQSQYGPSKPASIQDQLLRLKNAWDPTSPDCMFQAYFYNRVAPETASLYTKPDDHKQSAWDAAVADRPDNSVVPVLAKGFTDLQTRAKGQEQQILAYRTRIHEIANKLKELSDRHILHAVPKIETARRRHIEISRRALQLAVKVQVLKCRGYALRPEEEQLKTQLQALEKQLHEPRTFGRIDELWAKMTLVKLQQRSAEDEIKARGYLSTIDFETGDGLTNVESVLQDHHNGIEYLGGILKDDLAKIQDQLQKYSAATDKTKIRPTSS